MLIQKNEELMREIKLLTEESQHLLMQNQAYLAENKSIKRDTLLQKENYDELLRQNHAQLQTIKILTSKLQKLEQTFQLQKHKEQVKKLPQSEVEHLFDRLKEEIEEKNLEIIGLQQSLHSAHLEAEAKSKIANTETVNKQNEANEAVADEITQYLIAVMNDIRHKLGPWKNIDGMTTRRNNAVNSSADNAPAPNPNDWNIDKVIPASLDKLTIKERESVLRYLLSKLHIFDKERRIQKDGILKEDVKDQFSYRSASLPPINASFRDRLKTYRKLNP